jgi:hypothetical protein
MFVPGREAAGDTSRKKKDKSVGVRRKGREGRERTYFTDCGLQLYRGRSWTFGWTVTSHSYAVQFSACAHKPRPCSWKRLYRWFLYSLLSAVVLYWMFVENETATPTHTAHQHPHAQNNETSCNIELLHPFPSASSDALFKIGTAIVLTVPFIHEHLLQTHASCVRNAVTARYFFVTCS